MTKYQADRHQIATCPVCERVFTLNQDGTFRKHRAHPGEEHCPGSGRSAVELHIWETYQQPAGENMKTEDIVDAEVIIAELVPVETGAEVAVIPEQPILLTMLWEDVFHALGAFDDGQLFGHLRMIEILYPEMHESVGKRLSFTWPECPTWEELKAELELASS